MVLLLSLFTLSPNRLFILRVTLVLFLFVIVLRITRGVPIMMVTFVLRTFMLKSHEISREVVVTPLKLHGALDINLIFREVVNDCLVVGEGWFSSYDSVVACSYCWACFVPVGRYVGFEYFGVEKSPRVLKRGIGVLCPYVVGCCSL